MTGASAAFTGVSAAAASFSVTPTPPSVSGAYHGSSGADQNISTGSTLAVVAGGTAPFTYAWSQVGSSAYTWTISSPAAAATSFTAQSVGPGAPADAEFKVTVTDATGIIRTALVSAHVLNASTA